MMKYVIHCLWTRYHENALFDALNDIHDLNTTQNFEAIDSGHSMQDGLQKWLKVDLM